MSKNLLAKYYQENKERLQKEEKLNIRKAFFWENIRNFFFFWETIGIFFRGRFWGLRLESALGRCIVNYFLCKLKSYVILISSFRMTPIKWEEIHQKPIALVSKLRWKKLISREILLVARGVNWWTIYATKRTSQKS